MENNLNNKIKEYFRNREIAPDNDLWNVLETKLELEQTKQKSVLFKKIAYASVFIGFLFGIYLFLNAKKEVKNDNKITSVKPVIKVESNVVKNNKTKEEITKKPVKTVAVNAKVKVKPYKKKSSLKFTNVVAGNSSSKTATQGVILEKIKINNNKVDVSEINSVKEKNDDFQSVASKPVKAKKKRNVISDSELNKLLATAVLQKQAKDTGNNKIRINKRQVLYSVENEINKPLSNKVIKTLLAGARTVDNYITNN